MIIIEGRDAQFGERFEAEREFKMLVGEPEKQEVSGRRCHSNRGIDRT